MATTDPAHRATLERALLALNEAETAIQTLLRDGAARPTGASSARTPLPTDGLMEVAAAAERFGLAPDTVRKWCRSKSGLAERRGGRWHVRLAELRHLAERR